MIVDANRSWLRSGSSPLELTRLTYVPHSRRRFLTAILIASLACLGCESITGQDKETSSIRPLARLRSGPDGNCLWGDPRPEKRSAYPLYIARFWPKQSNFLSRHGGNDYEREIDVDCILQSYSSEELNAQAVAGDPLASYSSAVQHLQSGCEKAVQARTLLMRALPHSLGPLATRFERSVPFPEAEYMLAIIELSCGDDLSKAKVYLRKAAEGGIELAVDLENDLIQAPE